MALIACPECNAEVSDKASACPKCGNPMKATAPPETAGPTCERCRIPFVPVTKRNSVSLAGMFGALLFLVGLATMLGNLIAGLVIIVIGLVIGTLGAPKTTRLICPNCSAAYKSP